MFKNVPYVQNKIRLHVKYLVNVNIFIITRVSDLDFYYYF